MPLDAYRRVRYADCGMPNPFEFSDPVLGDSFADRKSELKTLTARMLAGQNVIVISPRRYGKTSLILNAQAAVRKRGGRTGIANLFWCQSRQSESVFRPRRREPPLDGSHLSRQLHFKLVTTGY